MFTLYTCHGGVMGRRVYKSLKAVKQAIAIALDTHTYDSVSDEFNFFMGRRGLARFYQEYAK